MKRFVLVLALALGLAGCAGVQQAFQAGQLLTASYTNPVTKEQLYQVENAAIVVFAGLNAYRQSCLAGAVEVRCRENIRKVQAYTRQIPPLLSRLRTFVKQNDQINAVVIYNQIVGLIGDVKKVAAEIGAPMGG